MEHDKMTSRKHQAQKTKETLLNTALDLIGERGYDQVTIHEICEKVGVSTGAFYHHFGGKEDIIVETYRRYDYHFAAYAADDLSEKEPLEQVIQSIHYQVRYAKNLGLETMRQFYKSQLQAGREFFISEDRLFHVLLRDMVKVAQESGALSRRFAAGGISRSLLRFSRGIIYDWCVHKGSYDLVEETQKELALYLKVFMA